MNAKITFSYAGNIGGLGQGYITAKAIAAASKMHYLYQLFSRGIQTNLKVEAEE
ncbi:MAG: hypothetical protein Q8O30_03510 [Candidatus Omnitrophota bacterium]|nr:hypothetical protein [Candidatus Omnitrophota bacterium]